MTYALLPNSQSERGFTLIELLIVFSIIAFLTTVGLASFIVYNRFQILNTAAQEFVATLNTAKIRSASQVMKSGSNDCSLSGGLLGYKVSVTAGGANGINKYKLYLICSSADFLVGSEKTFPAGVYFSTSPTPPSSEIYFKVLSGIVTGAGAVQIQDIWNNKKVVNVSTLGNISTN